MNEIYGPVPTRKPDVAIDFGSVELTGTLVHDDEGRSLMLMTEEGPERISVSLEGYGLVPGPGHVFIKDWSEHAGLAESLQAAQLVKIVSSVNVGPFATAAHKVQVTL